MCSYCGCESISVIGQLMEEHVAIHNAAGAMCRAAGRDDLDGVRHEVALLAQLLGPHTAGEELGLFQELQRDPEFAPHIHLLCAEHTAIDASLNRLSAGDLTGIDELMTLLDAHIAREENGVFPAAATALDGPAWDRVEERLGAGASAPGLDQAVP